LFTVGRLARFIFFCEDFCIVTSFFFAIEHLQRDN
jgi:hypothetical protein